jgi:hypothetical protein
MIVKFLHVGEDLTLTIDRCLCARCKKAPAELTLRKGDLNHMVDMVCFPIDDPYPTMSVDIGRALKGWGGLYES